MAEIRLRPLREDEFPAILSEGKRSYADDIAAHGDMTRAEAEAKAQRDFAWLLPNGLSTKGHFILVIEDAATGERVGELWFASKRRGERECAFLYSIEIDEPFRGRGLGRLAMLMLEDEVRARGLTRIDLNVFGGNEVARSLYRSLGYAEWAVQMGKELSSGVASPREATRSP